MDIHLSENRPVAIVKSLKAWEISTSRSPARISPQAIVFAKVDPIGFARLWPIPIIGSKQSKIAHSDCGGDQRDWRNCWAHAHGHDTPLGAPSQEEGRLAHPGAFVKFFPRPTM